MFRVGLLLLALSLGAAAHAIDRPPIHTAQKLSGEFTQSKYINDMGLSLASSGNFALDREAGILWQSTAPLKSKIIIVSGNIFIDGQEVKADSSVLVEMLAILQSVLIGDLETLAKYFEIKIELNADDFYIVMQARENLLADLFSVITMSGRDYVEQVQIQDKSGDYTRIQLFNIVEGQAQIE
ncbi:MAG: outer membrane lipoprotein carrier protein LolA [Candidatus Margulisbacteria bacterium]|jgi:hypothetical protein|nr:outer membrane lipoprotein carrier protein LolA [Candidatus Margulisiibacteriota bacterium]